MAKKTYTLQCTSAFMAGGKMVTPKSIVPGVPEADAKSLIRRGKAKIVEDGADDKALDDMTAAELKQLAKELEIDGADSMKKADLIIAIEAAEDGGE